MCHERENARCRTIRAHGALLGVEVSVVVGEGVTGDAGDRFAVLCADVEPRLRRALVAVHGPDVGSDAAAEAMAWAWEHLDRMGTMTNPAGYLWRVGSTAARRLRRRSDGLVAWPSSEPAASPSPDADPAVEPAVAAALAALSDRQRAAVLLVHGWGYGLQEAADVLGCRVRTLRTHLDRGMAAIRAAVGADDG
jgi:DNA-directed RNA polymerase specialized sigma24 family protein